MDGIEVVGIFSFDGVTMTAVDSLVHSSCSRVWYTVCRLVKALFEVIFCELTNESYGL